MKAAWIQGVYSDVLKTRVYFCVVGHQADLVEKYFLANLVARWWRSTRQPRGAVG